VADQERVKEKLVRRLKRMGYDVTLTGAPPAA
jgi:hypothetical protein